MIFNKCKKRILSRKTKQIIFLSFSKTLSSETFHANSTYMPIINSINKVIGKEDYNLIVSDVGVDEKPPPSLLRNDVDGIIFHGFMSYVFYEKYIKHLPHVGIQHYDPRLKCNWVMTDQWSIAFKSVEYLYGLGHRKISFLSDMSENDIAQERYCGYKDGLKYFNLPFNKGLIQRWQRPRINGVIPPETELPNYIPQITNLMNLENSPTAIICLGDSRALAVSRALEKIGYSIPEDVSVVGANNKDSQFGFTGACSNLYTVCKDAAQLILKLINGKHVPFRKIMIQPNFYIGTSTKAIN